MSVGGGLFTLAQTMRQGPRLTQGQQGLFDQLGAALSPQAQIDMNDPTSIRAAAEKEANSGNTVEAQRLLQIASQTEQRMAEGQRKNIKNTYRQMQAAGRGKEFEDTMIQAGRADEIGAIKMEQMREDVLAMEYGDAQRSRKVRGLASGYFAAKTNDGREAALTRMEEEGFGQEAAELRSRAAQAQADALDAQLRQSKQVWDQNVRQVQAMPIPSNPDDIARVRSQIPENMRGIYDQQVTEVLKNRADLVKAQESITKNQPLTKDFIEKTGMSYEDYMSNYRAGGPKVNETIVKNYLDQIRFKGSTLPTEREAGQLSALFDSVNNISKDWWPDGAVIDDSKKEAAMAEAWDLMRSESMGPQEAMREAIDTIAFEDLVTQSAQ